MMKVLSIDAATERFGEPEVFLLDDCGYDVKKQAKPIAETFFNSFCASGVKYTWHQ